MVYRTAFIAMVTMMCGTHIASAADRNVLAPIQTFVQAANGGNRALLISAFSADSEIVDEFAPYRFPPPRAAAHWYDGFTADQATGGISAAVITTKAPKFISVSGMHAYVVVPTVYTYRIHGTPARESGSLAFSLVKRLRWTISAMAWAKLTDTSIP